MHMCMCMCVQLQGRSGLGCEHILRPSSAARCCCCCHGHRFRLFQLRNTSLPGPCRAKTEGAHPSYARLGPEPPQPEAVPAEVPQQVMDVCAGPLGGLHKGRGVELGRADVVARRRDQKGGRRADETGPRHHPLLCAVQRPHLRRRNICPPEAALLLVQPAVRVADARVDERLGVGSAIAALLLAAAAYAAAILAAAAATLSSRWPLRRRRHADHGAPRGDEVSAR
mmetsp:Transcript_36567/g.117901  ORF Transcript_36567/g.117901 Transcript_36567/m.117901 type:complete len:226 (+) Transcript_36567:130-807(+)